MSIKNKFAVALAAVVASFMVAVPALAATTVVVADNTSAGENQPGWMFNRDMSTSTPYEFNTDEASIGTGSLYVKPIGATAADKMIAENFVLTLMADMNSISYDFMIGSGGVATEEEQFYMNVYANFGDSDDLKFYDCRYNIVPTVGSTSGFTTVTFDPTLAYPVTTREGTSPSPFPCPAVPADMDLSSPGSNIRVFALNVGDTSTSDTGLDGYLDKVVVDTDSDVVTYDFEPVVRMAEITSPLMGSTQSGIVNFSAHLVDDEVDAIQWAVREGTCAAGIGTVFGNVDGHSDVATMDTSDPMMQTFEFSANMSAMTPGEYCFIYSPAEDGGETAIRLTSEFTLVEPVIGPPTTKDECKKGGWMSFNNPEFKNQGDCVSFVASNGKSNGNPVVGFLRSLFN